jgi:hypothetical protein
MQARIAQPPDILDRRRETVEHPFGTIKQWMIAGAVGADDAEPVATHDPRRKISSHGSPR